MGSTTPFTIRLQLRRFGERVSISGLSTSGYIVVVVVKILDVLTLHLFADDVALVANIFLNKM